MRGNRLNLGFIVVLGMGASGCADDSGQESGGDTQTDSTSGEGGPGSEGSDGDENPGTDSGTTDGGPGTTDTGPGNDEAPDPVRFEPVFLPTGRVDVPYGANLPAAAGPYFASAAALPEGLELDTATGQISGSPNRADVHQFKVIADGPEPVEFTVQLAVFTAGEEEARTQDDPSMPGPFDVQRTDLSIDRVTVSTGTYEGVAVLVTHPVADGASGPFPVIAFHHAAHAPPDIFDDYGILHEHWASHGFVVASVDSTMNLSPDGQSFAAQSWQNLSDMSVFQRAAADLVIAEGEDPASNLNGLVDGSRVITSGHSRGGGASLISLWRDPTIVGAVVFEPVSPIQTPEQNYADPAENGDRLLPPRPIQIFSAAGDRDEPWPLVDTAYELRTGHTSFVTIHGTNHEWTWDPGTPGSMTSDSEISFEERHAIDQFYSTSFLLRFAGREPEYEMVLFGVDGQSSDLSSLGVSVHSDRNMATRQPVDSFEGDPGTNGRGGVNVGQALQENLNVPPYEDGLASFGIGAERRDRIAARGQARALSWSGGGSLSLDLAGLDARGTQHLVFRAARQCPGPPPQPFEPDDTCPEAPAAFSVVLEDASGEAWSSGTDPTTTGTNGVVGRHWTNVSIDLRPSSLDLTSLASIELRFDQIESGQVWIDDIRLE